MYIKIYSIYIFCTKSVQSQLHSMLTVCLHLGQSQLRYFMA